MVSHLSKGLLDTERRWKHEVNRYSTHHIPCLPTRSMTSERNISSRSLKSWLIPNTPLTRKPGKITHSTNTSVYALSEPLLTQHTDRSLGCSVATLSIIAQEICSEVAWHEEVQLV